MSGPFRRFPDAIANSPVTDGFCWRAACCSAQLDFPVTRTTRRRSGDGSAASGDIYESTTERGRANYGTYLPFQRMTVVTFAPCLLGCRGIICHCTVSGDSEIRGVADTTARPDITW